MAEKLLALEGISKTFPGVKALDDVSFDLEKGEVHILVGENGAGKSTLMKILAGVYLPDGGRIVHKGEAVAFENPRQAQDRHIAIIYQEFNLMPNLTVAQNICLGREPLHNGGFIDKERMRRTARRLLDFLRMDIDVDQPVSRLGVAHQQLVEVAKALSADAEILIMDEPTATLSEKEIDQLFKTIRNLRGQGVSIIYISHRLQEIKQIGDRVTVLRDGRTIGCRPVEGIVIDELIAMMVGRTIGGNRIRVRNTARGEEALVVEELRNHKLRGVSMHVRRGEIVGLSGLVGSGRTELARAIYGIDPILSGRVRLLGKDMKLKRLTPARCIRTRMGFIPENRKEDGLTLSMPIVQNVTQASLGQLFRSGLIDGREERRLAAKYSADLRLNTKNMSMLAQNLSGGNQQKVVLAKWLCTHSDFLIFDEPTRGIDVGAKEEIHNLIDGLAAGGVGIMMISSDLPEILAMSDRVYVMREGGIVKELPGDGTTQEEIIRYAVGRGDR
ncbi:MAG: sugar ABC transporter ATP-binding protein [Planctomycetota bacterium]|jgi:ribose transport system ATP-binding protein|nr:sugar ABC transporter ATP-binding protein [Planctomycetota bacterium]